MAQDIVAGIGARLEARLRAQEARMKTVEETVRTQILAQPPVLFALPERSTQFPKEPTRTKGNDWSLAPAAPTTNGFDVGATFRRKGVLSDVPMAVTRVENGMVYASFNDSEGSHEMAFDPNQLDLVENPLDSAVQATVSAHAAATVLATAVAFTPAPVPVVSTSVESAGSNTTADAIASATESSSAAPATVSTDTVAASIARAMAPALSVAESIARAMAPAVAATPVSTPVATPAPASANAVASATASAVPSTTAAINANITTPATAASVASVSANTTASITLPDGTQQFGFAPTGGNYNNRPAAYTPAVAPSFGEGATFRRKGVLAETPMTVTRTGDGLIFANYTDADGTREIAFYPNQLDLVTAAP